ncbi:hypothetical protein pclt_cds_729 [Pandoravirus celtis]|uniref:Uncharacterized protein n=1 Tax=Pandoravirus celtis TaxID=2568002 RepID=A0A4D6EHQ8_9VIRU|nr:hypothetical protein pclt_cds_729 [Pandoravirus celtis]
MHATDPPQHTDQYAPVRLDTLPPEIQSFIANGVDAAGHPILAPCWRFHLAQVSPKLRACVSCPLHSDAERLARHPGATEAWVKGRAASIALVVSQCQTRGVTPEEAARDFLVPSDPHRGEIAAFLATAPASLIVRQFVDMVERLVPTATTEWFPDPHRPSSPPSPSHKTGNAADDDAPLLRHNRACRNIVGLACLLGRADAVLDLFRWYNIMLPETMGACLRAAITRDDGPLVSALLCCAAGQTRSSHYGSHPAVDLFIRAMSVAGAAGKINALRHLVAKAVKQRRVDFSANCPRLAAMQACYCRDRRKCAFGEDIGTFGTYWVQPAATHDRVDVFACADAEGWFYNERHAIEYAVASGSINVAQHVAPRFDPTTHSARRWAKKLSNAIITERIDTDAESLARGLAWLAARGVVFTLQDTIGLAYRIQEQRSDLVPCVLAVTTPPPDPTVPFFSEPYALNGILARGHWAMLSRVIVDYGRASDEARIAGQQTHDPAWWTEITRGLQITSIGSARSCPIMRDRGRPRALYIAYRIARLCQRIPTTPMSSETDNSLVPLLGDIGDDNACIDPACWTRWCNPVPICGAPAPLVREAYDPREYDESRRCAMSVLALLDEAGLVGEDLASTPDH